MSRGHVVENRQAVFGLMPETEKHHRVRIIGKAVFFLVDGPLRRQFMLPEFQTPGEIVRDDQVMLARLPERSVLASAGNVVQREEFADTIDAVRNRAIVSSG